MDNIQELALSPGHLLSETTQLSESQLSVTISATHGSYTGQLQNVQLFPCSIKISIKTSLFGLTIA